MCGVVVVDDVTRGGTFAVHGAFIISCVRRDAVKTGGPRPPSRAAWLACGLARGVLEAAGGARVAIPVLSIYFSIVCAVRVSLLAFNADEASHVVGVPCCARDAACRPNKRGKASALAFRARLGARVVRVGAGVARHCDAQHESCVDWWSGGVSQII